MYDIVIPVSRNDVDILNINIPYIFEYLNPKKIVIIAHKDVEKLVIKHEKILFMDEDTVLADMTLEKVKKILRDIVNVDSRANWYFQQFLKMAYAYRCYDEKYVIWDSDTIPLNDIEFTNGDKSKSYFTMKTEYHTPYFETMKVILGIDKTAKGSFISEQMLIHKNIMLELIGKIENNSSHKGQLFYEKILYAIDKDYICGPAFSEYETYGTYTLTYHKNEYELRNLRAYREGSKLYGRPPTSSQLKEAKERFDTITFERW